ncbi:MAG: stage III sporulation protein AB [Clostridia bacterium]|nr:stage III sporulation protein AB [Clostridia bacterium]
MAMIGISAAAFLISDGEQRRVRWIQAMRRCLLRMHGIIRYEQPGLGLLLRRIDLRATQQERELTRLLHACAQRMETCSNPKLMLLFAGESAKLPDYGVLSEEDRTAFECVLGELGQTRLQEQIRLIDSADEQLRAREEMLARECTKRARLIRTLGLAGGAAVFLILI